MSDSSKEPEGIRWNRALETAAREGWVEQARAALEQGADPETNWNAPLHECVLKGHLEIAKLLLEAGAKPTKQDGRLLWMAAREGHAEITRLLLDHGADPREKGFEALRWAEEQRRGREKTDHGPKMTKTIAVILGRCGPKDLAAVEKLPGLEMDVRRERQRRKALTLGKVLESCTEITP